MITSQFLYFRVIGIQVAFTSQGWIRLHGGERDRKRENWALQNYKIRDMNKIIKRSFSLLFPSHAAYTLWNSQTHDFSYHLLPGLLDVQCQITIWLLISQKLSILHIQRTTIIPPQSTNAKETPSPISPFWFIESASRQELESETWVSS